MTDPQFIDLHFPPNGVDLSGGVGAQAEGTTPEGENVRALDHRTGRLRGGSRSGLSRLIDARVGGLDSVVQHLAVVTDHTTDRLPLGEEQVLLVNNPPPSFPPGDVPPGEPDHSDDPTPTQYPDDWVEDPLNPGHYVPPGGSGDVPNPNATPLDPPDGGGGGSAGWVYVQKKFDTFPYSSFTSSRTDSLTIENTLDNQLLLVAVYYNSIIFAGISVHKPTVSFSGGGLTWNELTEASFTDGTPAPPPDQAFLRVYWARNTTAGDVTVEFAQTSTSPEPAVAGVAMMAVEYKGLNVTTPFEGEAAASGNPTGPPSLVSAGAASQNGDDRLAAQFVVIGNAGAFSPDALAPGFVLRASVTNGEESGKFINVRMLLADDVGTPSGFTVEPTMEWTGVDVGLWLAVSSTYRHST